MTTSSRSATARRLGAALVAAGAVVLLTASPASAAITYRSSTSNTASAASSIVLSTPSNVQVGDVMVASVSIWPWATPVQSNGPGAVPETPASPVSGPTPQEPLA